MPEPLCSLLRSPRIVRRDGTSAWRIGSVPTRGGEPTYAAPKTGPTASKLAVARDVFYYDVQSGEVVLDDPAQPSSAEPRSVRLHRLSARTTVGLP
ncbi:MAG: hypothetical protein JW940_31975 [Polyangiaceae bacterium]|nr:hypothetical protein [Polyangiaceae bacterium]